MKEARKRHKNYLDKAQEDEKNYIKEGALYKILAILQDGIILHLNQHDKKPIEIGRNGWKIDEQLQDAVQEFINLNNNPKS
jgi:hypothetical protein